MTCGSDKESGQQFDGRDNCADKGLHCAFVGESMGAVCALQSERLADCEGKMSICQADQATTCINGFPMRGELCGTTQCECFAGAVEAGCVVSTTVEPKCKESGSIWVCDGDVAIHCFEERAAAKHPCAGCKVSGFSLITYNGESCI